MTEFNDKDLRMTFIQNENISFPSRSNLNFQDIISDCKMQLQSRRIPSFRAYYVEARTSLIETWNAFELLYIDKKVDAIGVKDISALQVQNLLMSCYAKPMFYILDKNIEEFSKIYDLCQKHHILCIYDLKIEKINQTNHIFYLQEKYNVSILQILFQFFRQMDIVLVHHNFNKDENFQLTSQELFQVERHLFSYKKQ